MDVSVVCARRSGGGGGDQVADELAQAGDAVHFAEPAVGAAGGGVVAGLGVVAEERGDDVRLMFSRPSDERVALHVPAEVPVGEQQVNGCRGELRLRRRGVRHADDGKAGGHQHLREQRGLIRIIFDQ